MKIKIVPAELPDNPSSREAANCLSNLTNQPPDVLLAMWNIDEEIAPILRKLTKEECIELYETHKAKLFTENGYFSIYYIPKKMLSVSHSGSKEFKYYSIAQYFQEVTETPELEVQQELADKLASTLQEMKIYPTKLSSPIAMYFETQLSHMDIPDILDMPYEVAEYAWAASGRLWIEAFQLGYWEDAVEIDIVSAFPNTMRKLYDIRKLNWHKGNKINGEKLLEHSVYCYCKCKINIEKDVTAIVRRTKHAMENNKGSWTDVLNKREIQYIRYWELGKVEILDGHFGLPNKGIVSKSVTAYPFEVPMKKLIYNRSKATSKLAKDIYKGAAVGTYGKTGAYYGKEIGKFNPVYFTETATNTRIKLGNIVHKYNLEKHLIHAGVDGVLCAPKISNKVLELIRQNEFLKVEENIEALVASSGQAFIGDRKPMGISIADVKEKIQSAPYDSYYRWELNRRVTLGEAIKNGNIEELGKMKPHHVSIDIMLANKLERDRNYEVLPKHGYDLMNKQFPSTAIKIKEEGV